MDNSCLEKIYLELVLLDDVIFNKLPDGVHHSKEGNIGFSSSSRCADEQVFIGVVGCFEYD